MINLTTFVPAQSRADDIAAQKQLAAAGYYRGDIDGQFYAQSKAALRTYLANRTGTNALAEADETLGEATLDCMQRYVGLYELPGESNRAWGMQGTSDRTIGREFAAGLQGVGWQAPWSYCAAAVKLAVKQACAKIGRDFSKYDHILSLGVLDSWKHAQAAGLTTQNPSPGDAGCMREGSGGDGHMWLFRGERGSVALTREANTSPAPSDPQEDRNGGVVTDKTRPLSYERHAGLWLMGFIRIA